MEWILMRWEARTRTLVRQIAESANFVRTWPDIWRHNLMIWHDIDLKFSQYVSNWSMRGYGMFRGDPPRFTWVICEKPSGVRWNPLQVRGLIRPAPWWGHFGSHKGFSKKKKRRDETYIWHLYTKFQVIDRLRSGVVEVKLRACSSKDELKSWNL